jgi:hypothetical protein
VQQAVKAAKRSTCSTNVRATPPLHVRRVTTIVFLLCKSTELAAIWANRATRRRLPSLENLDGKVSEQSVLAWAHSLKEDTEVKAALQALGHHLRELADDFLIETLVIQDLLTYWSRGIQTTTEVAVVALLRKWRRRPRSEQRESWLQRVAEDTEYRKSWGRYFRGRWNLRWAGENSCRYMTSTVIQRKAAIFIRWIRWAALSRGVTRTSTFINMDETTISC